MSRTTSIIIVLVGCFFIVSRALAGPLMVDEVAGTYRIAPNLVRVGQMPTNFFTFALFLNTNGTFAATNVPANVIFNSKPAAARAGGTWKLRYEAYTNSWIYTGQNYIDLDFTNAPGPGSTGLIIDVWSAIPFWDKGQPCIRMDCMRPDNEWLVIYLAKQR